MCGIAGILSSNSGIDTLEQRLVRLQRAMQHRGPDDSGMWMNSMRSVGIVHTRLSILDLSPGGHQPMISACGRRVICFNGEIYNFKHLRASLESRGVFFKSQSDTEVLLKLYEFEGEAMLKSLRGMFAFCIWDEDKKQALLARDPLGIKPLYIYEGDNKFAFASELRPLTGSGLFESRVDAEAVRLYFETGTVPEPLTLAKEVRILEAGHTLVWCAGLSRRQQFWSFDFSARFSGDAIAHTRDALIDSVRHHFVSDVPVGVFLSGGIDSTAILALANETGHRGIHSFSIAVDDKASDESQIAERSANHFGSEHHEMMLDAKVACGLFEEFLKCLDQPTIDGLNTYTVSSLARQHGIKVVLSGLGADELFGGYASFKKIPKMIRMHSVLSRVLGLRALLQRGKPQHRRMADFLNSSGTVEDAYSALRGIFSKTEAAALTAWIMGSHIQSLEFREKNSTAETEHSILDSISQLELTRYMRNQLLRDSDVMSMTHSLELRVPFVDRVLTEQMCMIPVAERLRGHKTLLTDAVPEVPDWVVNRKKRGFLFPYQKWLSADWGSNFADAISSAPVRMPNWYQKWSVFVLKHCIHNLGIRIK